MKWRRGFVRKDKGLRVHADRHNGKETIRKRENGCIGARREGPETEGCGRWGIQKETNSICWYDLSWNQASFSLSPSLSFSISSLFSSFPLFLLSRSLALFLSSLSLISFFSVIESRNPLNGIMNNIDLIKINSNRATEILSKHTKTIPEAEELLEKALFDLECLQAIEQCAEHQRVITDDVFIILIIVIILLLSFLLLFRLSFILFVYYYFWCCCMTLLF